MTHLFRVDGLRAAPAEALADGTSAPEILKGLDLVVESGEVHAIMGPNGSGKSTLASTLMGSPEYEVPRARSSSRATTITDWPADERAKAGMFLAFQYPQEIPGVSVIQFLRQALSARKGIDLSVLELRVAAMEWMQRLGMDSSFVDRYLNEGFSGGEKKRNEIMQLAILEPELAILDETDSGLDIDALRIVAKGIREVRADRPEMGVVLITHYQRLLDEVAARPHPHPRRRPDRRLGRHGARRAARARRLRGVPHAVATSASRALAARDGGDAVDIATLKERFPVLRREIDGAPIVYLDSANTSQKPQSGDRGDGHVLEHVVRADQPQRLPARRRGHRRVRGGPRQASPASSTPATPTRWSSPRTPPRRLNLVASVVGRRQPARAATSCVLTAHGAPRQHRAVAHARRRAKGIELRWVPLTADGQLDLTDLDRAARRRQGVRRSRR